MRKYYYKIGPNKKKKKKKKKVFKGTISDVTGHGICTCSLIKMNTVTKHY